MHQYLGLLKRIKNEGRDKGDRTGTGTKAVFGHQMRFDLQKGFPLLTTKKLYTKAIIYELLWFLKGGTNTKYLNDHGVKIWNEWADENGDLGPVYGKQWRSWPVFNFREGHAGINHEWEPDAWVKSEIDQIAQVVADLKNNPDSRRHIVCAWNVAQVPDMALAPCHLMFQFDVTDGMLSCQLYQRSCDVFLGVPFNIASYSLLTMMVAQVCNLQLGDFIWTGGDCHLYLDHLEQADLQLTRHPKKLPEMQINTEVTDIDGFGYGDFKLIGYRADPHIPAPISK